MQTEDEIIQLAKEKADQLFPFIDSDDYPDDPDINRRQQRSRAYFMSGIHFVLSAYRAKNKNNEETK